MQHFGELKTSKNDDTVMVNLFHDEQICTK